MPITLKWYNDEKTILLETFIGQWTLDEYRALVDQAALMLSAVKHEVHIIVDGSESLRPPSHMTTGMRYALQNLPKNQGMTIFVKADLFARLLIGIATKVSLRLENSLHTVETLPQALALIEQWQNTKTAEGPF